MPQIEDTPQPTSPLTNTLAIKLPDNVRTVLTKNTHNSTVETNFDTGPSLGAMPLVINNHPMVTIGKDAKPVKTPLATGCKFQSKGTEATEDPSLYRSVVGALQYLTITRPDLAFTVHKLCQYMHRPLQSHWKIVKRVLRYINGTRDHGLLFEKSNNLHIICYCDSDWAFDQDGMRSASGYCLFLGSNVISWMAKKQQVVSRSSTEAEYRSLAALVAET
ncbi:uncharacterized protein LOC109810748 [Cajanus cajan]|uniref:uncharacterized protein LOC109796262 n=1 Tax=Cajanus cajan TaxID=3821 RepID=UPI00098D7BE9|nr:uncharacterized protein LOC109796262 [Cajanus cajan]XP_020229881.1 uncharacterized protein LOC109810748 [Cajanus cajan]